MKTIYNGTVAAMFEKPEEKLEIGRPNEFTFDSNLNMWVRNGAPINHEIKPHVVEAPPVLSAPIPQYQNAPPPSQQYATRYVDEFHQYK
jgi:hypothetical protein